MDRLRGEDGSYLKTKEKFSFPPCAMALLFDEWRRCHAPHAGASVHNIPREARDGRHQWTVAKRECATGHKIVLTLTSHQHDFIAGQNLLSTSESQYARLLNTFRFSERERDQAARIGNKDQAAMFQRKADEAATKMAPFEAQIERAKELMAMRSVQDWRFDTSLEGWTLTMECPLDVTPSH